MRRPSSRVLAGCMILSGAGLASCATSPPPRSPEHEAAAIKPDSEGAEAAEATQPAAVGDGATAAPEPAPPALGVRTPGGAIDLDGDDGLDADIAELSASTGGSQPVASAPASATGAREIVYRVTPQGLVIELDGIHLRPEAKPFKDKKGAYGIELVLNAESFDGRQYWLNKPNEGPLSIAGKIESKDGKSTRFADQRTGGSAEVIADGAARSFRQRWPGRGQPRLWWGQTVTLEIGLWGVRSDAGRERPVRRLFVVKMVAGNKPVAVITPPALDWGS